MPQTMDTLPDWQRICASAAAGALDISRLDRLQALHERIAASPDEAALVLESCRRLLQGTPNFPEQEFLVRFREPVEVERLYLLIVLACHDAARCNFIDRGYPGAIFDEVWTDLQSWTGYHLRSYGDARLGRRFFGWYQLHVSGQLVQFGRLQFQLDARYTQPEMVLRLADGRLTAVSPETAVPAGGQVVVRQGDPVIGIHIPEGRPGWLPLSPDECVSSLRRLRQFVGEYCPNLDWSALHCHSWLLDAALVRALPPSSNIANFARLAGGICFPDPGEASEALWRLFGDSLQPPAGTAEEKLSTLQRAALAVVRSGGKLVPGGLVIPRHNLDELDSD